eukprot:7049-Heterococcus_DN1.PRE.2
MSSHRWQELYYMTCDHLHNGNSNLTPLCDWFTALGGLALLLTPIQDRREVYAKAAERCVAVRCCMYHCLLSAESRAVVTVASLEMGTYKALR